MELILDPVHATLVKELVRLLCLELDYHYEDEDLAAGHLEACIRTVREAAALLSVAGAQPPEIYEHIIKRWAEGERKEQEREARDRVSSPSTSSS
jgi:hypothetical protein